jgi:hypothetical protein
MLTILELVKKVGSVDIGFKKIFNVTNVINV